MLIRKSPEQIKQFLRNNIHRLEMPELWVGDECNTYGSWGRDKFFKDLAWFHDPKNDSDNVRVCYAPPCDLVQTAGNQTINLIYQLVNDRDPKFLCERGAFPPTKKDIKIFNNAGIPPFSLESKHPIFTSFDAIGTTLAFPGFYVNLVKYFRDAGISPLWRERDKTDELYPFVFCGGQIFAQPGPIEPVVDAVVVGEGEDGISGSDGDAVGFPTLLYDILVAKQNGSWYSKEGRLDLLHEWARKHHWLYVPRFYNYRFHDPRTTKKFYISHEPIFDDIPARPKRRWIKDIDAIPCCTAPIINAHDPSMGLGEIEASRSCTGKCSFCAEIYRYAPYRERSVEYLVNVFRANIRNSGSTNAFPTGFDFPCYSRKHELYVRLMQEVCADVDTQSSRVDHFIGEDSAWAKMAGQGGMRQLAVGVEGNSERLRMIMSKGATEKIIIEAFMYAIENQFDKVKFFMIADWEWETPEDTQEIIELGRKLMEIKKQYGSNIGLRFSWTPLLIEAWTPLQWCRAVISKSDKFVEGWDEAIDDKKLVGVKHQLDELGIKFTLGKKTEQNYYYFMQAFHMADRLLGEIMVEVAGELDQVYCGAVDRGFIHKMSEKMAERGLTWDHYFRRKDYDETFWWDVIDLDLPKEWFMAYHKKMMAMVEATDPRKKNKLVKHDELVSIGTQLQKENPKLKLQTRTLERGMLVTNCDTGCCACMACEEGTQKALPSGSMEVEASGKVDFYRDVMLPQYFKKNKEYDAKFKGYPIHPLDESSVAHRLQMQVEIDDEHRFLPNSYWVSAVRRALYRSDIPVTKLTIKIASDVHGYKPYISGAGFVDFGVLRNCEKIDLGVLNQEMPIGMRVIDYQPVHRDRDLIQRNQEYLAHFHYVLNVDLDEAKQKLRILRSSPDLMMRVKRDEYRKGLTTVEMRIDEWLHDAWLIQDGHDLILSMLMLYGEPTPYNIVAAVFNMHEADAHFTPCRLKNVYYAGQEQIDFFTPVCCECGASMPRDLLGRIQKGDYCLIHQDKADGRLISAGAEVSTEELR